MNKSLKACLGFLFLAFSMNAQEFDSVRVMSYNLLYFGENTSFCTNSNNPVAAKDGYLKTIVKHANPDVLVVNELGSNNLFAERILVNSLNTDGVSKYARLAIQNNGFSSLVNGVFYNKNKFGLDSRTSVSQNLNNTDIVRVIDVMTLYYKDPSLAAESDTVFLHVLAAHLKAGSSSSDITSRGLAAEAVMSYLQNNLQPGNFLFCGDLNLKNSSEQAFQELTSNAYGDYRFYDPINQLGSWNNNSSFSQVHTQSTRNTGSNSCFSGGGLDDRFDLIMMSGPVVEDTGAVSYIEDSYQAMGNDGMHFNQDINAGANNSVPAAVLSALYEMSDHLPVLAELKVKLLPADTTAPESISETKLQNSVKLWQQLGEIRIDNQLQAMPYELYSISGALVQTGVLSNGYQRLALPNSIGVFVLKCNSPQGVIAKKIVIAR
jgi:endonuclease/exonuclease/phosphatase family metal-dependent hydrolase